MKNPMNAQNKLRAVKTLVRVTLNNGFKIRPRTEVSSLLIVQPAAKIQSPEPRVERAEEISPRPDHGPDAEKVEEFDCLEYGGDRFKYFPCWNNIDVISMCGEPWSDLRYFG